MAGLPKPILTCICGAVPRIFKHLRDPERWICGQCNAVLVSRPSRRLAKGRCRNCGATPDEKPFKKGKNQCKECAKKELDAWKLANKDKIRANRQKFEVKRRRHATVRKAIQRSAEAFLRHLSHSLVKKSNYKRSQSGQLNPICLIVEITYEDLLALWERQGGLCAILHVPMAHEFNRLDTVSIDRIDSTKGYVPGNVQLVCQFVNSGKRHYLNSDVERLLDAYFLSRVERSGHVLFPIPKESGV